MKGVNMEEIQSIDEKKEFIFSDFRATNYISIINRELEFYFNHYTQIKDSLNISRMEGIYLILLRDNYAITQVEITEILKADAALVSKFTKSLIEKDYIYSEVNKEDKRKKSLFLTEKAKRILPEFLNAYRDFNETAFKNFDFKEHEEFIKLLNKFFNNVQSFKIKKTL